MWNLCMYLYIAYIFIFIFDYIQICMCGVFNGCSCSLLQWRISLDYMIWYWYAYNSTICIYLWYNMIWFDGIHCIVMFYDVAFRRLQCLFEPPKAKLDPCSKDDGTTMGLQCISGGTSAIQAFGRIQEVMADPDGMRPLERQMISVPPVLLVRRGVINNSAVGYGKGCCTADAPSRWKFAKREKTWEMIKETISKNTSRFQGNLQISFVGCFFVLPKR